MNSITNHEVVSQLDRVLASPNFIHSSVLAKFLRHIVHETVEGRGHELKEYTIGVAALKKDADFNPQIDSIVRIHAGRLRRALRDYYQTDGATDPIAIVVPKGSYVPIFEINPGNFVLSGDTHHDAFEETSALHARGDRSAQSMNLRFERLEGMPSIYVAPFKVVSSGQMDILTSLPEYLSSELTKFEDLVVISGETELSTSQRADYVLRGTLHLVNQRLRIFVYLQGHDGRQYWAKTFAMTYDDLWQMEDDVVAKTVAAIAGINGVISRVEAQLMVLHAANEINRPLSYWYKQHINHFDSKKTHAARLYYEDVLSRAPDNALAAAYLSEIICRQAFFEGEKEKSVLLARAHELSHEALLMDPTCQQAYHATAMISMVLGRTEECMRAIEKGLTINANSVDYQAGVGSILIYLGKYDRGMELLERALELLPDPSWGHLVSLAINAFHNKAYKEALGWLDQSKVDTFWLLLVRAAAAVNAEEPDLANAALAEFRRKYPAINPAEKSVIDDLFVLPEVAQSIHEALQKLSDAPLYISERKSTRYSKKGGVSL
jgi:TolB-like protein